MPVTVVVGGQFGSEGKGKVAHFLAFTIPTYMVIRCGGPNSGHTVVDPYSNKHILRHLPTAVITDDVRLGIAPGSYIDLEVLLSEIKKYNLTGNRLYIDEKAVIISNKNKEYETSSFLSDNIGSTCSGTGAAVQDRVNRNTRIKFAGYVPELSPFMADIPLLSSEALLQNKHIIIEGTQGFGLSLLHSPYYPFVTSRDTTAAGFISEVGISPLYVKDIVMVIRSYPIRVPGNSGPLYNEVDWSYLNLKREFTSVTRKIRRVGLFEPGIVRSAIAINKPTKIVLNHLDYVKNWQQRTIEIQGLIQHKIDYVGLGPDHIEEINHAELTRAKG